MEMVSSVILKVCILGGFAIYEKNVYSVTFLESFVVFNINRKLSAIESHPTNNGGIDLNILHGDSGAVTLQQKLSILSKWIKKDRILKSLFINLHGKILKTKIYRFTKNFSLRKYFKY